MSNNTSNSNSNNTSNSNSNANIFEQATRRKLQFTTAHGLLNVGDIWGLSLVKLNRVAQDLNKEVQGLGEESFIEVKEPSQSAEARRIELRFEIVKHVIKVKLAEQQAAQDAKDREERKQHLLNILADKQNDKDKEMSLKDIKKELDKL